MGQAADQLGGRQIMGDAVAHYRQHLEGRTAIGFCCSVAHAEAVAATFQGQGIAAASIDGTMSAHEREVLLGALGAGELQVLASCSLIGEGVDVPSVAGCLLLRPTQSVALHLQMIGRCLRPQPGKTAVILDHTGNYQRLGHHLDNREWSLEGRVTRSAAAAPSVAVCGRCFAAYPSGAAQCPECSHVAPPAARELAVVAGELREVELAAARARREEQGQAATLEELIRVGLARGMRNPRGWARHVLAGRSVKAGRASARFN
jgi:superfamily II DNA or RNA helicase